MRDLYLLLATKPLPSPSPSLRPGITTETVRPGVEGFIATALVVVAAIILMILMVRKIRAMRYRELVKEEFENPDLSGENSGKQAGRSSRDSLDTPEAGNGNRPNKPWRH